MKLIMESWRRFLREHQEIDSRIQSQVSKLMKFPDLAILIKRERDDVYFRYVRVDVEGERRSTRHPSKPEILHPLNDEDFEGDNVDGKIIKYPYGKVDIRKPESNREDQRLYDGPCMGGWIVQWAHVSENMGPLLYDVAMEWASQNGSGLMADRNTISPKARSVWDKYSQRPGVEEIQLDIDHDVNRKMFKSLPRLTPKYQPDDCDQEMAVELYGDKWSHSPLSRLYRKNTTEVMTKLAEYGRLIDET
tara:strand:- start:35 stop:778 length:744 start_codon:yes stop_codon:yes gene_type:complete